MSRPRLLDLFSGSGGCSVGYHRAGFDVTGVDSAPMPRYPFRFVQADALEYVAEHGHLFDAIHASPPCQAHSTMRVMPNAREHPDLIEPTRTLLVATGKPYVIENVVGAPLDTGPPNLFFETNGVLLCGTMFGLRTETHELRRHRLFESNVPLEQPRCHHHLPVIGFYGDHARTPQRTVAGHRDRSGHITGLARKMPLVRDLLGIDWMLWREAVQAIPPAYCEFIGRQILRILENERQSP